MKRLLILTGEASGELYAIELVKQLKLLSPSLIIDCTGSKKLEKICTSSIMDLSQLSSIGFVEIIPQLYSYIKALIKLKKYLKNNRPNLVLAIDNQGFNVQLLKYAKKINLNTAYFIAPQEWQWGKKENGIKIASFVDTLFSIFKEEHEFYKDCTANSLFIGHPLKEVIENTKRSNVTQSLNLSKEIKIGLFPGSRKQELLHVAPTLFKAAYLVQKKLKKTKFYCALTNSNQLEIIQELINKYRLDCEITFDNSYDIIPTVDFSICKSGTNILEHAFFETPCISMYNMSFISTLIINQFLRKKFEKKYKYFSLPNIIAKDNLIPEFYLENCQSKLISDTVINILTNDEKYKQFKSRLKHFNSNIKSTNSIQILANHCHRLLDS